MEGSRRGRGRKVVVVSAVNLGASVAVEHIAITGSATAGYRLGQGIAVTYLNPHIPVKVEDQWNGEVVRGRSGSFGKASNNRSPKRAEGEGQMAATKEKGKSKGAKGAKGKAKETPTRERASEAELDKLAARVVTLRDDKGKSWAEIEETLEVAPSRLRALYNRGGGEPTRERKGSAKAADKAKGAKGKGKGKGKKGKADPSE
jgi:hypothetical protein